jgi:hypothetical protein
MAQTTTAAVVIDRVLEKLNEVPSAPRYWSREEIRQLIWEGLVELNLLSGYLQDTLSLTLARHPVQPTLPHIAVLHVRSGYRALLKYSIDELDASHPNWESEKLPRTPARWAPLGLAYLVTHKRTTTASQTVTVDVLRLPVKPLEADVIPLDDEYVVAIAEYAASVARLKEGGAEQEAGVQMYQQFLALAGDLAERWNWKRMPAFPVLPRAKVADAVPRRQSA